MHQHQILDGVEKLVETIHTSTWMYSAGFSTPSSLLCKYLHFLEWSRKTLRDHPNSVTDTQTDGSERFRIHKCYCFRTDPACRIDTWDMMEIQNKLLSATNKKLEVLDAEARSVIPKT